jgi:hypothetical protein
MVSSRNGYRPPALRPRCIRGRRLRPETDLCAARRRAGATGLSKARLGTEHALRLHDHLAFTVREARQPAASSPTATSNLAVCLTGGRRKGRTEGVQIIAISDHGHITGHTRVSVIDSLRDAGFRPDIAPAPDVDVVVVPRTGRRALSRRTSRRADRPTRGDAHRVFADHARAPDVSFAFRADDGIDPFGLIGDTFYDNDRGTGLGLHGGLHPKELAAVGIAAGSAFPGASSVSTVPGIGDFVPTILHLLESARRTR